MTLDKLIEALHESDDLHAAVERLLRDALSDRTDAHVIPEAVALRKLFLAAAVGQWVPGKRADRRTVLSEWVQVDRAPTCAFCGVDPCTGHDVRMS